MEHDPPIDLAEARKLVEERVAGIPWLADSRIAPVPDLDAAGLRAFSVMPEASGKSGEVIYLVGAKEILTAGTARDFDRLMALLEAGDATRPLPLVRFARLFLRLRVLRRGEVLDRPDGHVLLKPGQLPASRFLPPRADHDERGVRYRFWIFDTDRLEPVFWEIRVAPDGATTFTSP